MEKILTLAKALELIKTLAKKLVVIEDEIVSEARGKSFRGHDLYPMVSNRMLYYIATEEAMYNSLTDLAKEYEIADYSRLKALCRMDNSRTEKIMSMRGILSLRMDALGIKEKIQALNDYIENAFEDADFKRIKKLESIAMLKALKLV